MKGPFISKYCKACFQFFFLIFKAEIIELDGEGIAFTKEISYTSVCITYVQADTRRYLFLKHIKGNINLYR